MINKRRGLVTVVMVLSLLAFVGFSVIPIVNSIIKAGQNGIQATPSPTQTISAKQADLQAQARGYELVLQREPDNQTALQGLLQTRLELIRLKQGDMKDVIPPLEKLFQLNPQRAEYGILLAQAKAFTGDREGAAQTYRGILSSKPGEIQALQGLADLLVEQKRPEAAIGLLQDTLKAAPAANQVQAATIDVVSVQLILGQVYSSQKRYDEALAIYDAGIKADPQDFRPVFAKALLLKEQGKKELAQELFTKAGELAPAQYKDQIKKVAAEVNQPVSPAPSTSPSPSPSPSP